MSLPASTAHVNRSALMEQQNVGKVEQRVRMAVGSLASLLGMVQLVPGEASPVSGTVGTMLVIAGLYLLVTGSTGYCPIYRRSGRAPWRTTGEQDGASSDGWRQSEHDSGVPTGRKHRVLMILYCLPPIAVVAWIALRVREP